MHGVLFRFKLRTFGYRLLLMLPMSSRKEGLPHKTLLASKRKNKPCLVGRLVDWDMTNGASDLALGGRGQHFSSGEVFAELSVVDLFLAGVKHVDPAEAARPHPLVPVLFPDVLLMVCPRGHPRVADRALLLVERALLLKVTSQLRPIRHAFAAGHAHIGLSK